MLNRIDKGVLARLHPSIKAALKGHRTVMYELWRSGDIKWEPETHFCRISGIVDDGDGWLKITLSTDDEKSFEFHYNDGDESKTQVQHDGRVFRTVIGGEASRITIIM